jgi:uncharacterized protein (DUF885 family)
MRKSARMALVLAAMATPLLTAAAGPLPQAVAAQAQPAGHAALVALYDEFRQAVLPPIRDGVADYSPSAMAAQKARLDTLMRRLRAIDDSGWPVAQRVDWMLVLAEMRGAEFQHRVLKPWARDPAFYSTTNLGFGPKMATAFGLPELPMPKGEVAAFAAKLRAVPPALAAARRTLTEPRGDLARLAIWQKEVEANVFGQLAEQAARHHPELVAPARAAQAASGAFKAWLESIEAGLPAHGGVGRENYDWYLKNVLLFPYDSRQIEEIGEREYQRQVAFLKIEEHRNRAIPMTDPVQTRAAFDAKRRAEDEMLLAFLRDNGWMTIPDWLRHDPQEGPYVFPFDRDPKKKGLFDPPLDLHFFFQAEFRDGLPLRAHNLPGHAFDGGQYRRDDRAIRGKPRLFFVNGIRAEGWAFYLEEFVQQAGLLEDRPKTREINYILGAKRAARLVPELRMQANEWTWEQANADLIRRTPRWMQPGDAVARFDIELYLRQPGYGIGYYMGKVELEKLLAERAMQLGDAFDIKAFHDGFRAAGSIPISLIRWEMTGRDDEIRTMR